MGINASYKEAAALIGCKTRRIKPILFTKVVNPNPPSNGKGQYLYDWTGVIEWWKCPDRESGPRSPSKIKGNAIGTKAWDRLKQLFAEKRELIESEGVTMRFVIRLCRANRLPANEHIVNEMLRLMKITLKGDV